MSRKVVRYDRDEEMVRVVLDEMSWLLVRDSFGATSPGTLLKHLDDLDSLL